MLERLHFILGVVWVKVYPRQQPNYSAEGESLKEEGALAVVFGRCAFQGRSRSPSRPYLMAIILLLLLLLLLSLL